MIYKSNLAAPDLSKFFRHLHIRPMPHSFGHSVPSDWADKGDDDPVFGLYKNCGMWTHDEAAILYNCALQFKYEDWIDIGCHTGWTSRFINEATEHRVACCDPMLAVPKFRFRFYENTSFPAEWTWRVTSNDMFRNGRPNAKAAGYCIDGDHEPGKPLEDAMNAFAHLKDNGVILLHDFVGKPVREAVQYLMSMGLKCRIFYTPHGIACCWQGDFEPPDHVPDPNVKAQLLDGRLNDFDFTRCE
jgi:hypothetical protein